MPDTPVAIRELIWDKFYRLGLPIAQIARDVQKPRSTVASLITSFERNETVLPQRRRRCGVSQMLSPRTCRLIRIESQRNPRATASQVQAAVGQPAMQVSVRTMRRYLSRTGQVAYRPVSAPNLNGARMRYRLQWCRERQNWTVEQWRKVNLFFKTRCIP